MTAHFVQQLDDLLRQSLRMASQVEDMLQQACDAVFSGDAVGALEVIERDHEIDHAEVQIETEVIRLLALFQPVGVDLRRLCTILKVNNELESIADSAVNIAERARHQVIQDLARESIELKELIPGVRQALRKGVEAYARDNVSIAYEVLGGDSAIDALYAQIVQNAVAEPSRSAEGMAAQLDLLSVAKNLERIADEAGTIAKEVIFLSTGEIIRHRVHG